MNRRTMLAGAAVAASSGLVSCDSEAPAPPRVAAPEAESDSDWLSVRNAFALEPGVIHMSAMLIASHPRPVREAIERHRQGLDTAPVSYLERHNGPKADEARAAAGRYLGLDASDIALTDSTTMGVGLVYNGLRLRPGDEILSTQQDYYVTLESLRQLSLRTGAAVREIPLYDNARLSPEAAVARIAAAITPRTRVVALTWVHSSTGYKLPAGEVGALIDRVNATRDEADRIVFGLDGVHGFGVENVRLADLGCDYFMAGCHKWLFGPRGTGIVAAGPQGYGRLTPAIPSFIEDGGAFDAWISGGEPGPTTAARMSPGGFKAFEHRWALPEAFAFHQDIGREAVAARTHALARQLKEGLQAMPHVELHTPLDADRSAGIVAFDLDGMSPQAVVSRLRERGVVGSVAPYATPHVRLTPSVRNTSGEIETVLREVRAMA